MEYGKRASSYQFLEDILRDIFANNQIVDVENIPALRETLQDLYQKKILPETDYTTLPLHEQFCYALLREYFVSGEPYQVADQVKKMLNRLLKTGIIDKATT
jgi:hypothetical protein